MFLLSGKIPRLITLYQYTCKFQRCVNQHALLICSHVPAVIVDQLSYSITGFSSNVCTIILVVGNLQVTCWWFEWPILSIYVFNAYIFFNLRILLASYMISPAKHFHCSILTEQLSICYNGDQHKSAEQNMKHAAAHGADTLSLVNYTLIILYFFIII